MTNGRANALPFVFAIRRGRDLRQAHRLNGENLVCLYFPLHGEKPLRGGEMAQKTREQLKKDIGVTHRALDFLRNNKIPLKDNEILNIPERRITDETTEGLERELSESLSELRIVENKICCPNWGRQSNGVFSGCDMASCDGCWARHLVDWAKSFIDPETEEFFKRRRDYAEGEKI